MAWQGGRGGGWRGRQGACACRGGAKAGAGRGLSCVGRHLVDCSCFEPATGGSLLLCSNPICSPVGGLVCCCRRFTSQWLEGFVVLISCGEGGEGDNGNGGCQCCGLCFLRPWVCVQGPLGVEEGSGGGGGEPKKPRNAAADVCVWPPTSLACGKSYLVNACSAQTGCTCKKRPRKKRPLRCWQWWLWSLFPVHSWGVFLDVCCEWRV